MAVNLTAVGSLAAAAVTAALKAAPALHPRARYIIALGAFFISALWPAFATFSPASTGQVRVSVPSAVPRRQTSRVAAERVMDFKALPPGNHEMLSSEPGRDGAGAINGLADWLNNTPRRPASFACGSLSPPRCSYENRSAMSARRGGGAPGDPARLVRGMTRAGGAAWRFLFIMMMA